MTGAAMDAQFPADYFLARKTMMLGKAVFNVYKVHDASRTPLLFVYERAGLVIGVSPISDRYRTDRGIGMGNSLGDLLYQYGKISFRSAAGKPTQALVAGQSVQFFFDEQKIDFKNGVFPPDARIDSILIGEAPEEAD